MKVFIIYSLNKFSFEIDEIKWKFNHWIKCKIQPNQMVLILLRKCINLIQYYTITIASIHYVLMIYVADIISQTVRCWKVCILQTIMQKMQLTESFKRWLLILRLLFHNHPACFLNWHNFVAWLKDNLTTSR